MAEPSPVVWSPRRGRQCASRAWTAWLAALGLASLGVGATRTGAPLLIYNASASAPLGYYRVKPAQPLRRGELVLVRPPASVRAFAAERGYLPASVMLVKRIAALNGDHVCSDGSQLAINGRLAVRLLHADRLGRPLPAWTGCRALRADEMLLLMTDVTASFDSRYFGPAPTQNVVGRLEKLGRS